MEKIRAQKLQKQIAKEAIAVVSLGGEAAESQQYEQVIRLIGKAWRLSETETDAVLDFIRQEKEVVEKLENGETLPHIQIDNEDVLVNWSGMETLQALEDLFKTSLYLDSCSDRKAMFDMALLLGECQNFLDWIEQTEGERQLVQVG